MENRNCLEAISCLEELVSKIDIQLKDESLNDAQVKYLLDQQEKYLEMISKRRNAFVNSQ